MRRSLVLAVLAALAFGVSGCAALQNLFESAFQRPDFRFKNVALRDISLSGLNLDTVWSLRNPNPVGLSLATVDYKLSIEGKQVVAGAPRRGLQIPAEGQTDLSFPANIKFADLAPTVGVFLNQDVAHYRAEGHIGVQTPIGVLTFPISKEGTFEVPKVPQVQFGAPRITSLSFQGAQLEVPIQLTNRNSFPLPVGGIRGNLSIGGASVGQIATGNIGTLQGRGTQTVKLPVTVNFLNAFSAANAIRQGRGQVALSGQLQSGSYTAPINPSALVNFLR